MPLPAQKFLCTLILKLFLCFSVLNTHSYAHNLWEPYFEQNVHEPFSFWYLNLNAFGACEVVVTQVMNSDKKGQNGVDFSLNKFLVKPKP